MSWCSQKAKDALCQEVLVLMQALVSNIAEVAAMM